MVNTYLYECCNFNGMLQIKDIICPNKEYIQKIILDKQTELQRKHPIKYTLYFHKIENSISTLVKS